MKKKLYILLVLVLTLTTSFAFSQVAGTLDSTFNQTGMFTANNGFNDLFTDVAIQPDQKIVAAGISYDATWSATIQVFRFLPDGTADPDFGTNGIVSFSLNYESNAYAIRILDDGKIVLAGITTGLTGYDILLLKLNEDGSLDNTFGTDGVSVQDLGAGDDIAYDMDIQEDGKIVVAGIKTDASFLNAPMVARFTADGQLDTSFGTNGMALVPVTEMENEFASVLVQPDGRIIASGHISTASSVWTVLLARFNEDGTPDNSFGTGGLVNYPALGINDEAFGMALTESGDIVISGYTLTPEYNFQLLVAKFDGAGSVIPSFGTNGSIILGEAPMNVSYDCLIQPDGKILVGGTSGEGMAGDRSFTLWRFEENGSPDNTFGTSGIATTQFWGNPDEINGMALQDDGRIVAAGKARTDVDMDFAIARYLNDINTGIPAASAGSFRVSPNPVSAGETINVSMEPENACNPVVSLYTLTGSQVADVSFGNRPAGKQELKLPIPRGLPAGVYMLRIKCDRGDLLTHKIIVLN